MINDWLAGSHGGSVRTCISTRRCLSARQHLLLSNQYWCPRPLHPHSGRRCADWHRYRRAWQAGAVRALYQCTVLVSQLGPHAPDRLASGLSIVTDTALLSVPKPTTAMRSYGEAQSASLIEREKCTVVGGTLVNRARSSHSLSRWHHSSPPNELLYSSARVARGAMS